jgi:fibronectin type 3 domain-containing protein
MGTRKRVVAMLSVLVVVAALAPAVGASEGGPARGDSTFEFVSPSGQPAAGGANASAHRPSYLPINPQALAHSKRLANQKAGVNAGGSTPITSPADPPVAGPSWNGQYETDLTPPDPTGAMGPTSYIELINLRYGIYDRSGALISQGTMQDLTGLPQGDLSDPQIAFDPDTGLFYYSILDFNTNQFGVGWSLNDHPQSAADFCRYVAGFGYGDYYLPDYPKLGLSKDFILIGSNVFLLQFLYTGSDLAWISKPPAGPLAGCPSPSTFQFGSFSGLTSQDGSDATTPVPAVQTDPSGTGWVVAAPDVSAGSADYLTVFPVTKSGSGAAVLGAARTVFVPSYSVPAAAPQPGGPTLDTLDGRLERAVSGVDPAQGGAMAVWTAHAVFGGAGSEERWYEIDPVNATLFQSGVATSDTLSVWNGAVSPDRAVNGSTAVFGESMVMGFSTSSPNDYPAIQMVSKTGGDRQSDFVLVKQSPGPNVDFSCASPYGPPCRWGDYSGASPDPAADPNGTVGAVWLSGEWNEASADASGMDWRTWNWRAVPGAQTTATVPGAPTGLTATAGDGFVDLAWAAPDSDGGAAIEYYNVYRGTASGGESFYASTTDASTTFTDSSVTNGTEYFYEVAAVNTIGESPVSNEVSETPATVPGAPTGLTATAGDGEVLLNWSPPDSDGGSPITGYNVYRGTASGGESFYASTTDASTTFTDSSVTNGTEYFYEVAAVNTIGESDVSDEVSATPTGTTATVPDAPTNLTARVRGHSIQLYWSPPTSDGGSPITGYDIYRGTSSGSETFLTSVSAAATGFKDTSTLRRTDYWYYVVAINAVGESDPSDEASATTK